MMRWLVESCLKFRVLVVVAAVALLAVGAAQLRKMPVEVLPDFSPTTVEVQTEALGLSAAEVEQLITVPLEQDLLNGIAFLDDIRSQSVPGLSRVLMIFKPGTDVFRARQVVAERLTQAHALPQVSKPPRMLQPLSSTNRVLMVGVSSKSLSALQMSVLARWTIAPRLVGVPGVANVSVWGQEDRQLQVQVDPERLRSQRVDLGQVIESTANALWVSPLTFVEASTPGTGGFIDTPNQRLGIQHISPINTAADLSRVRLEDSSRRKLQLRDVATVVEDHQPLIGDAVVNGKPGLLLVVERFPGTNLLEVTRGVEGAINEMKPGLSGIRFDSTVYRPASYVQHSIDNVSRALLIGLALLVIVLGVLFFRWPTVLICVVVIPLSLVTATLVLWAFGITMNAIVLAGLAAALVIVIDDAVVNVEKIGQRLRQQRSAGVETSTAKTVLEASLEVRGPVLYATLILALAVLPVFFLERLSGAFFPDLAVAYLLTVVASMLVALTVTPALGLLVMASPRVAWGEPSFVKWLQGRYETGLARVIQQRRAAYIVLGSVLALALVATPFLKQSLLPTFKENDLLVRWDGPPGTSLPEMNRITALASRELRSIPGVSDVGGHAGRAVTGDQVVGANSSELWVSIDPSADYGSTVSAVKRVVAGYPGFTRDVQTYSQERVRDVLSGAQHDVVVRVYGEDLKTLANQAGTVRNAISSVSGISSARVLLPPEEPTLQVKADLAKADKYDITPGEVRRAATTLLSGLVVGSLFEQQKVFDVVVWGKPQVRDSLTSVRRLLIDTPSGGHVRLSDVADVRIAPSPGIINRQSVSRYVDVGADLSGRSRDAVVRDVQKRLQGIAFPLQYHAEVLASEQQPVGRLISIAIAAIIGTFLLLQAMFGSWRLATLALLVLPLGVTGGLLALLVTGEHLSFGSYVALFAVFGLATRSTLLLLDRLRRPPAEEESQAFGADLVTRAARDRLAPVVTTAFATAAVFVPVLILSSEPGFELLQPVAIVFLGGLVTTLLVTLYAVPLLYLQFGFAGATEPRSQEESAPALAEVPEAPPVVT
jgi:CzcA family heavy metal efflux pump